MARSIRYFNTSNIIVQFKYQNALESKLLDIEFDQEFKKSNFII